MSRRIALGKLGTNSGTAKYGLRVSKTSSDAVPSASSSATVAPDNLIFDSLNPVGSMGLYKVITLSNVPAITESTNPVTGGGYDQGGTPGNSGTNGNFGETLSFIPLAICQQIVNSDYHTTAGAIYSENVQNGPLFPLVQAGSQDSEGPSDAGWYFQTTTSRITVYNYQPSTINVRCVLFYTPLT